MNANRARTSERGISVIESSIVFLVIAIIVAIALPAVSNTMNAYNLRSNANQIAERLSLARALAMEKNGNVTAVFRSDGTYGVDFSDPLDGVPDTQDPDEPSRPFTIGALTSGIIFPAASFPPGSNFISITFNSRGELPIGTVIPAGAPGLVVTLQGASSQANVIVNLRGRIWTQ